MNQSILYLLINIKCIFSFNIIHRTFITIKETIMCRVCQVYLSYPDDKSAVLLVQK